MAFRKLVCFVSVFLSIIFANFTLALSEDAIVLHDENGAVWQPKASELELHQLKSKISSLEISAEDQTSELKIKVGGIKQLEKLIEEKSNSSVSLQSAVRLLQEKELSELKERIGQINTHVYELEKQILNRKKEIEAQNKIKGELEAQANAAEKKIEEVNLKLENLRKINGEQKSIIRKTQLALQVAEEAMLKAKLKASLTMKQLTESFVLIHWKEIGRPAFDLSHLTIQKIYEVEKWLQPHLETMKTKCLLTIKGRYNAIMDYFHPWIQSLPTQAIDYYHMAWSTLKPRVVKIQETMDQYFQAAKMFTNPCINKAHLLLKAYSKKVVHYHNKIIKSVKRKS